MRNDQNSAKSQGKLKSSGKLYEKAK